MIRPPDPPPTAGDSSSSVDRATATDPGKDRSTVARKGVELIGSQIGNYRLEHRLGEGGMGEVFRAVHLKLGGTVAIKLIHSERLGSPVAARRFLREVQVLAQMDHPHIVRALDAGEDQGRFFLVLEYIDGEDLEAAVRQHGPLPITEVIRVGIELGLALQHLHAHGLIHRDVKPANLIRHRRTGLIKLLDLGLTRFEASQHSDGQESSLTTQQGFVVGTPDFMSPEQAINSRKADIRSDLYSSGCTLFFLLTGTVPFPGGTAMEKLVRQHQDKPADLLPLRSDTPPQLAAIVAKLMAKQPEARYQTPGELVQALLELQAYLQASAPAVQASVAEALAPFANPVDFSGLLDDDPQISAKMRRPAEKTGVNRWVIPGVIAVMLTVLMLGVVAMVNRNRTSSAVVAEPASPPTSVAVPDTRRSELLSELRRTRGTPEGVVIANQLRQLPSPLDALPSSSIGVPCWLVGQPLRRHDGQATAIAASRDGQWLASAGEDAVVRLWDLSTLNSRGVFSGHITPLRSVAVSPSGLRIAAASGFASYDRRDGLERALRVWDRTTGKEQLLLDHDHGGWTITAKFAGAEHLLLAGQYQVVTLWDLNEQKPLRKFLPPKGMDWVNCLELSPDGRTLFAGSNYSNQLHVWDFKSGKYLRTLSGHDGAVVDLAAAPDLQRLASCGGDRTVRIWNFQTGVELVKITRKFAHPQCLVWCAQGRELAIGWSDGTICWFDPQSGQELRRSPQQFGPVTGLVAIGLGDILVSSHHDGSIRKWNCRTAEEIDPPPQQAPVTQLGFAAGDQQLIALPEFGEPLVFELPAKVPKPPGWKPANWWGIALSADGDRVICLDYRNRLSRWLGPGTDPELLAFSETRWLSPNMFSPDATRFLYVVWGSQRMQAHWADLTTNVMLQEINMPGNITALAISPDGKSAAITSRPGVLCLIDLIQGKQKQYNIGERWIKHLLFTPDSQEVIVQTLTDLRVLSRDSRQAPVILPVSAEDAACLEITPDNRFVVVGTRSGTIQLVPRDGRPVRSIRTSWPIRALAVSSDSQALAVAFRNGMLAIYRLPVER